jgi:Leucine-rich repeat (LRR) protein
MKLISYVVTFLLIISLSGCETSRTYYGQTATSIDTTTQHYRLDLSFQSLKELPSALATQTSLRMLNLSGNPDLNTLSTVCQLPNLHILILNDLQLTALPDTIQKCRALTQLSLVNNPELNFNTTFETLSSLNLEFLDLSNNQLNELPDNLGQLKTLRDLRLSYNHISQSKSYTVLAQLPRLFSLWLDNNRLNEIPNEIGLLHRVGYLYLDNNSLTKLPQGFRAMRGLSSLRLGHNCFRQVPPTLADRGIYMVFLNNNKISDIGDRFRRGSFLVKGIVLDYNYLSDAQRKESAHVFHDTFIYSDDNQYNKSTLVNCGNDTTTDSI